MREIRSPSLATNGALANLQKAHRIRAIWLTKWSFEDEASVELLDDQ